MNKLNHILQQVGLRPAENVIQETAFKTASFSSETPSLRTEVKKVITLPPDLSFARNDTKVLDLVGTEVKVSPEAVNALVYEIINSAAELVLNSADDFYKTTHKLAKRELPSSIVRAIQGIVVRGIVAHRLTSPDRVKQAVALLPMAVHSLEEPEMQFVTTAFWNAEREAFVILVTNQNRSKTTAHMVFLPPAIQHLVKGLTLYVAYYASPQTEVSELAELAAGQIHPQLVEFIVGMISVAVASCDICPVERRKQIIERRELIKPIAYVLKFAKQKLTPKKETVFERLFGQAK